MNAEEQSENERAVVNTRDALRDAEEPPAQTSSSYRSLSAADEPEEPRYNACSASAVGDSAPGAAYRGMGAAADDVDLLPIPPPMRANAGTINLD